MFLDIYTDHKSLKDSRKSVISDRLVWILLNVSVNIEGKGSDPRKYYCQGHDLKTEPKQLEVILGSYVLITIGAIIDTRADTISSEEHEHKNTTIPEPSDTISQQVNATDYISSCQYITNYVDRLIVTLVEQKRNQNLTKFRGKNQ